MQHAVKQIQRNAESFVQPVEAILDLAELRLQVVTVDRRPWVSRRSGVGVGRVSRSAVGTELVPDLALDRLHIFTVESVLLSEESSEHQPIAKGIDASRDPPGELVYPVEAHGVELRIAVPADMLQPVLDVGTRFLLVEWPEVVGRNDALPKLLHLRALHHRAKLWLADEEALQKRLVLELKVGKHPQFFDRFGSQVLRFIDDEQRSLVLRGQLAQERLERPEQDGLVYRPDRQPICDSHCAKHVVRIELSAHELGGHDLVAVQVFEEAANDGRLARADFAGNDDEAFTLVNAVLQIRVRALVPAAAEEEGRVGIELERLTGQ